MHTQVSYMTQQLGFLAANSQRFAQSLDLSAAAKAAQVCVIVFVHVCVFVHTCVCVCVWCMYTSVILTHK
jgi:hypothetical protein